MSTNPKVTTTTKGATTTTKGATTTTKGATIAPPQCAAAFNKYMTLLNTSIATMGELQTTFTDIYNQFKLYGDPSGLGCTPLKGGKFSRKKYSKKRRNSHTKKSRF